MDGAEPAAAGASLLLARHAADTGADLAHHREVYKDSAAIDWRNDSQVIYSDEIIPGSTLLGFLNADHWAIAVPLNRSHPAISRSLVDQNDYPREALLEALLRFIEEDLDSRAVR